MGSGPTLRQADLGKTRPVCFVAEMDLRRRDRPNKSFALDLYINAWREVWERRSKTLRLEKLRDKEDGDNMLRKCFSATLLTKILTLEIFSGKRTKFFAKYAVLRHSDDGRLLYPISPCIFYSLDTEWRQCLCKTEGHSLVSTVFVAHLYKEMSCAPPATGSRGQQTGQKSLDVTSLRFADAASVALLQATLFLR